MTCDVVRDLIDRHVRGTLAEDERSLVERHAATCAECREALADARALAAATALLPRSIEPARDLWPGVSTRLAGPKRRPDRWRLAIVALAASIALVAGSSAVTLWLVRAHPARVAATTTPAIEAGYVNATENLMRALDAERSHLAPATVATLERNLGVIDAAIAESRAALATDPGNRDLAALLWASYRQKVALLQQATRLVERS
jgi:anti-sigma factor RsiW